MGDMNPPILPFLFKIVSVSLWIFFFLKILHPLGLCEFLPFFLFPSSFLLFESRSLSLDSLAWPGAHDVEQASFKLIQIYLLNSLRAGIKSCLPSTLSCLLVSPYSDHAYAAWRWEFMDGASDISRSHYLTANPRFLWLFSSLSALSGSVIPES